MNHNVKRFKKRLKKRCSDFDSSFFDYAYEIKKTYNAKKLYNDIIKTAKKSHYNVKSLGKISKGFDMILITNQPYKKHLKSVFISAGFHAGQESAPIFSILKFLDSHVAGDTKHINL